jgi:CheY-like chemotaxis protein
VATDGIIDAMVSSMLVVDDDPSFLALATRILEEIGVERILLAESAATAMTEAEANRPQAALVDVFLADRDGIELAHQLAALPWSPRVVLTSTDKDAVTAIDRSPGAASLPFLPKEELTDGPLRELLRSA